MKKTTMDILTINPGSTTTKIAVFQDMVPLFTETITHDADELKKMKGIFGQLHFRESLIKQVVAKNDYNCLEECPTTFIITSKEVL